MSTALTNKQHGWRTGSLGKSGLSLLFLLKPGESTKTDAKHGGLPIKTSVVPISILKTLSQLSLPIFPIPTFPELPTTSRAGLIPVSKNYSVVIGAFLSNKNKH